MEIVLAQLRDRQVAVEKVKTFESQQKAAEQERSLKEAQAIAEQQSSLTASQISIQVKANEGAAEAKRAEQDALKIKTLAEAEAEQKKMVGTAEAEIIRIKGEAEASAIKAQVDAYGGPQFQLSEKVMGSFSDAIKEAKIDIVPKTVVNMGGDSGQSSSENVFMSLLKLIMSEKLGVTINGETTDKNNVA